MKLRSLFIVLCLFLFCAACSGGSGGGGDSTPSNLAGHWTGIWTDSKGDSGDAVADLNQDGKHVWGTFELSNSIIQGPQTIDEQLPSDATSGEIDYTETINGVTYHATLKYDPSSIVLSGSMNGYSFKVSLHR